MVGGPPLILSFTGAFFVPSRGGPKSWAPEAFFSNLKKKKKRKPQVSLKSRKGSERGTGPGSRASVPTSTPLPLGSQETSRRESEIV